MAKQCFHSERAPAAVGPYSQAVSWGGLMFCSGMLPLDPETGECVPGGIEAQTRRVLENLAALLEDCGSSLQNIVKTTCFLKNMDDFAKFNTVYAEFFPQDPPARSTVEVARLPRDVLIEIEALAYRSAAQEGTEG